MLHAAAAVRTLLAHRGGRVLVLLGVNVVVSALGLLAAEAVLQRSGRTPFVRTYPGRITGDRAAPWARPSALFGWTIEPSFGDRSSEINPQGFRDGHDFDRMAPSPDRVRVVILGDSFMAGANARDANVPSLLQARLGPGYDVVNLGVYGWGVDQMYAAYLHFADRMRPRVVVLAYIDDDIARVVQAYRQPEGLYKPVFVVENDEVRQRTAPASSWERAIGAATEWSVLLGLVRREVVYADGASLVVTMLRDLARRTAARDGALVVVRLPTRDDAGWLPRWRRRHWDIEGRLRAASISFVDAAPVIVARPDWPAGLTNPDGHYSPEGDRLVAGLMYEQIVRTAGTTGGAPPSADGGSVSRRP